MTTTTTTTTDFASATVRTHPPLPPGWVAVPVEPTAAMVQAAHRLDLSYMPGRGGHKPRCRLRRHDHRRTQAAHRPRST